MLWKDIKGYEGRYCISDTGIVKSCEHWHKTKIRGTETLRHRKERYLKPWKRDRYLLIDLWKDGVRDVRSIHILVYEAFIGTIPEHYIVHHKDSNKYNNSVDNLTIMSIKEHNALHHVGRIPWNKGKDCHELVLKSWKTRKEKLNVK